MHTEIAVAVLIASRSISFDAGRAIVSMIAMRGAPPERRAEIIDAVRKLFGR